MKYTILGLREMINSKNEKYYEIVLYRNLKYYCLTLQVNTRPCPSGYCNCEYGEAKLVKTPDSGSLSHITTGVIYYQDFPTYCCPWFEYSYDGGNIYYPEGYVKINFEMFTPTNRIMNTRPVWIFQGPSNIGKSFLAHKLIDLRIYETDSANELPITLTSDIIVLGQKYPYSLDDIKNRISSTNIILVNFDTA